jgi:CubicO group peptidase (beta-lactamase class C family)
MFVAMGRDGQFLNVVPSQQLVVVRMGNAPSDLPVPYLMNNEIWRYINNLECTTTSAWDRQYDIPPLKIFPNPVRDILHVEGAANISRIQIFNLAGQLLQTIAGQGKILRVPLDGTPKGMYFAKVFFDNGGAWTSRFVKE